MAKDVAKKAETEEVVRREPSPIALAIIDRARATGHYGGGPVFMLQALGADTLEAATEIGEVVSVRDNLLGERLHIIDVTFLDGDDELDAQVPIFAVIDCFREMTGEQIKATCGAEHVVGVLIRACEMDWFPFDAEIVSVKLGSGKAALNLKLAPTRVDAIDGPL